MNGESDSLYRLARCVLLDALAALGPQRDAVVLVGAQAVYLHTGDGDLAVAPFTKDADMALDPSLLHDVPELAEALGKAGFRPGEHPGSWLGQSDIPVDLLVPATLGGPGRRGARLGIHGNRAARKVAGLEGALVDKVKREIRALESDDVRAYEVWVAGPAALLVSKLHKLAERKAAPNRLNDKDALDVFRLLVATETADLAAGMRKLIGEKFSKQTATEALGHLTDLFSSHAAPGIEMLIRAVTPLEDSDVRTQACVLLVSNLFSSLGLESKFY